MQDMVDCSSMINGHAVFPHARQGQPQVRCKKGVDAFDGGTGGAVRLVTIHLVQLQ